MSVTVNHPDPFLSLRDFTPTPGATGRYYALSALEEAGLGRISRLPVSIRVVLEALLRHCGEAGITEQAVKALAGWQPNGLRNAEIPFIVARIVMPDSSGIPLLADLAAMREAAQAMGHDPSLVEPSVAVDLIVDHSVQADHAGTADALNQNMALEFERNGERFKFLKWATQAFKSVRVIPPGFGIIHQVNLEYLSPGVHERDSVYFPDTLIGADSHTPMINGLGVVGWGVGGIEAEAGMLGQPVFFLTPDVVGVELKNRLRPGVTATDAVLSIVQRLRQAKVVNKFIEYFGEGAAALSATDRATIANMTPETGATIGFFPVDERTAEYYAAVGRTPEAVDAFRAYYKAQSMWGIPRAGDLDYSTVIEIDLAAVVPSIAGPRRPHDRLPIAHLTDGLTGLFRPEQGPQGDSNVLEKAPATIRDGSIVLAAITSCTNTSNPRLMLAAGLLAKKAAERGLNVASWVKTSFSPGSRAVSSYLEAAGLQPYLDRMGYQPVGYGCMTCIGNSGPLAPAIEQEVVDNELVVAAVLSGNRNFEARIHPVIKSNFLMSPPLVVAFAIAGRIDIDLDVEPLCHDAQGKPVMLAEIWPSTEEIDAVMHHATDAAAFRRVYAKAGEGTALWQALQSDVGPIYHWEDGSTYLKQPPFFDGFTLQPPTQTSITGARALAIFGDSITTDHISPASSISPVSPAGEYLQANGVTPANFNSYIARRANHEVMIRGTFANVRIRNLMVPGSEGGVTVHQPDGRRMSIYEAATSYAKEQVPLIVIAGQEYGTGSSRDWAGKGTILLGVRAVIASSFERIHRNNLVGMGVLPCQFLEGTDAKTLSLDGSETYDIAGIGAEIEPGQQAILRIHKNGLTREIPIIVRIETPVEVDYIRHGGILPYVLRDLLEHAA